MSDTRAVNGSEYWAMGLQFLDSGNYIAVNRTLVRVLGLHEAVIIGELASEAMQWARNGKLDDGWFYATTEKLEYKTSLSAHIQRKALGNLSDLGIVEIEYKGIPKRRYVRINFRNLMEVVNDKSLNSCTSVGAQDSPLYVQEIDDINNQQDISTIEEKPTNTDVDGIDVDDDIPYAEIVDHLNQKSGKRYRVTDGTKGLIRARWREEYTLEDFKTVIDNMCAKWLGTEREQYLRPSTLFKLSKFDEYLNATPAAPPSGRVATREDFAMYA